MKRTFLLFVSLIMIWNISKAQINEGGSPLSFDLNVKTIISDGIPVEVMPAVNIAALQAEDVINDVNKSVPWRFGQNIPVHYDLSNSGVWDSLPNGNKIWRLNIQSSGALTINLNFDNYHLPLGAKLFIYSFDQTKILGAFTKQNNQADHVFATTLIESDNIIIEYDEPANPEFAGEVSLDRVTHGYRSAYEYAKAFGDAGSCQNNVVCPLSAGWESQIRAVCMLVSGGNGFCSGSLVNNTSNDGTPYILTANHCYSTPTSWVFWFNWQSTTCTNPGSSPTYNSISGATLVARDGGSDFCLVQMSSAPALVVNAFYAGWNNDPTAPTSTACIHHPSADIKKFSTAGAGTSYPSYDAGNGPADCWNVSWTSGCTEPGSSGSPLFDQNKRIVGQLYGGPSACGVTPANMNDYFGKFATSWNGAGTPTTRLKDWLDPGGTNPTTNDGYDPNGPALPVANFSANVTTSCTGIINFTDLSSNSPISWSWNFGDGNTATTQNPSHSYAASGTYTVQLIVVNGVGQDTVIKTNYIVINMPTAPTVTGASICISGSTTLTASGTGTLNWYDAPTGGNLVNTGTSYVTPVLSTTTTYYVENDVSSILNAGKTDSTGGGGYTSSGSRYLIFDCYTAITLVSVQVYGNPSSAPGSRTISLCDNTGTVLQSTTVTIPSGLSTVNLNFSIPIGTSLRLMISSSTDVFRNNAGLSYPYTTIGYISVTSSDAGNNRYYAFYNWVIAEPVCSSARTPVTATIINNLPVANFTYSSVGLTANFTNLSTNATSYGWLFGDGTSPSTLQNPSHTYAAAGTYNVHAAAYNSCGGDTTMIQVTVPSVGIAQNPLYSDNINVYPNPSDGNMIIQVSSEKNQSCYLKVINLIGQEILAQTFNMNTGLNNFPIDLSHKTKGIYFIKVLINNKTFTRKIVNQ